MDIQTLFNVLFAAVGALGMWILNGLKDGMNSLHKSNTDLAGKVQAIELLVAGTYVKKDDLDKMLNALFVKLDKIELKLDNKADKHG